VPQGNRVDANLYAQGQAGNAKFNTHLVHLKDPNYSPGSWCFTLWICCFCSESTPFGC
jgi:hypothetical protein